MYILSSSKDVKLVSIDPFQSTQWKNGGKKLLKLCNLIDRHKLIEEKSFIAMPKLINKVKFDMIFIDGWHTFDYTLIDFFYALELLNMNGIIIIDDAFHKGVNKCIKYIETNYKNCKRLVSPPSVACFKKVKNDTREWDFHVDF
jgi:predicted O-methyltransferase YrrM